MTPAQAYDFANGGALVFGFAMFIWWFWYTTNKLEPAVRGNTASVSALAQTVSENQKVNEKLIENNAAAFRELALSNQNVATALSLLTRTMESQDGALDRHETQSGYNFNAAFNRLDANTKAVADMRTDLLKHVTQCDARYGNRQPHP